jgi:hypothetical protein
MQLYGEQDGLHIVISIGSPSQHMKTQVDLCKRSPPDDVILAALLWHYGEDVRDEGALEDPAL